MKTAKRVFWVVVVAAAVFVGWHVWLQYNQVKVLNAVIDRLSADSRIAEVLVTDVNTDANGAARTTIKFLEYDTAGRTMAPKYFTFMGNVIQFESLVIRFEDKFVKYGDAMRGKSAYIFLKAFSLNGKDTEEFDINKVNEVPSGYETGTAASEFEKKLWREFWDYAMGEGAGEAGVKNAQIEAPGTKFVPGVFYTIKIEHDGGMRIDANKIPEILRGEKL